MKMNNSYSIKKKLIVINLALEYGVKHTSSMTRIHQSCIYKWIKNRPLFEFISNKSTRRIGAGGKSFLSKQQEQEIRDWIVSRNDQDLVVNYKIVSIYCRDNYSVGDCLFTTGWFARFKKRHDFVLRRVTSYSHKPTTTLDQTIDAIKIFRDSIAKLDPSTVLVNMDETPVWFDNQSRYTVTTKGTRHVKQRLVDNCSTGLL